MAINHLELADAIYEASEQYADDIGDVDGQISHLDSALRIALGLLSEDLRRDFIIQCIEKDLSPELNEALQSFIST